MHALLHSGKCGTHGGIYNYQWEQFFKTFNNAGLVTDGIHFNPADPAGSIEAFMERLREVTAGFEGFGDEANKVIDVLRLPWPFRP